MATEVGRGVSNKVQNSSSGTKTGRTIRGEVSEEEDVLVANFLSDLNVGSIGRTKEKSSRVLRASEKGGAVRKSHESAYPPLRQNSAEKIRKRQRKTPVGIHKATHSCWKFHWKSHGM